jgi:hypothetical protein
MGENAGGGVHAIRSRQAPLRLQKEMFRNQIGAATRRSARRAVAALVLNGNMEQGSKNR